MERPSDPEKRRAWDRAVAGIEGYRQEHGIEDRDSALGKEPRSGAEQTRWHQQRSRLAEQQQELRQEHSAALDIDYGMEIGIG